MVVEIRSKKEVAKAVARAVGDILGLKQLKRETVSKQSRVDKSWFNATITKTCNKHNVNEVHIRKVGGWVIGAEIKEVEADE